MNKTKTLTLSLVALATIGASAPLSLVHASNVQSQSTNTTVEEENTVSISNTEILNQLKTLNPTAYAAIPADVLAAAYHQDLLRQGSTYVKKYKNGNTRVYINSALVKLAKYTGAVAIAGAVASIILTAGISTVPASMISTAIAGAVGAIPADRGAWFEFNSRWTLVNFGRQ